MWELSMMLSETLLQTPTWALLAWLVYHVADVRKLVLDLKERIEKLENMLNIPVNLLYEKAGNGEVTLGNDVPKSL